MPDSDMGRPGHCVVIGAGVVGVCVAARLAGAGVGVTLLEQGEPGHGATRWSFAWLNANSKLPRAYHDLNRDGLRAWAELAVGHHDAASEGPADGGAAWHRRVGNMEWAADPAGRERLAARVDRLAGWGYQAHWIGRAQAAALEPSLRLPPTVTEVAWFPEEGYLNTARLVAAMTERAVRHGAALRTGEPGRVTGFETGDGAITGVRTATGETIETGVVVCCAGRWTPGLAALAGSSTPVPLVPWAEPGADAPGLVVQAGPVASPGLTRVVHAPTVHLRPHPGGQVHIEAPDAAVDLHTPQARLRLWADELLRRARGVAAGLERAEVTGYQVCVRPMPADGQSIVGWLPGARGLYAVVTHSGVTLAAHLAGLIAAELTTGTAAAQLAPYRPDRFTPTGPPGKH